MAAVEPVGPTAEQLAETSAELGREIAKLRAEMKRVAELAGMRNDPALPLISVLASSLDAQWRLHNQAVRYFRSTSERLDKQYLETMAQAEAALDAKRMSVVESLVPQLAETVKRSVRAWNRAVTWKTALVFGGVAVSLAFGVGMAGYGAGWQAARQADLNNKATIDRAIQDQGLPAQAALAEIVGHNNLAAAWAKCQSAIVTSQGGERFCNMALWLDSPKRR